jgi:hypothetical protein
MMSQRIEFFECRGVCFKEVNTNLGIRMHFQMLVIIYIMNVCFTYNLPKRFVIMPYVENKLKSTSFQLNR